MSGKPQYLQDAGRERLGLCSQWRAELLKPAMCRVAVIRNQSIALKSSNSYFERPLFKNSTQSPNPNSTLQEVLTARSNLKQPYFSTQYCALQPYVAHRSNYRSGRYTGKAFGRYLSGAASQRTGFSKTMAGSALPFSSKPYAARRLPAASCVLANCTNAATRFERSRSFGYTTEKLRISRGLSGTCTSCPS